MDIIHVDVSGKGLRAIEPVASVVALRGVLYLDASRNVLEDLRGSASFSSLESLSLYYNRITDAASLAPLSACTSLRQLDVRLNPLCQARGYRR